MLCLTPCLSTRSRSGCGGARSPEPATSGSRTTVILQGEPSSKRCGKMCLIEMTPWHGRPVSCGGWADLSEPGPGRHRHSPGGKVCGQCLLKSVPGFMKGRNCAAMRVALNEIEEGRSLKTVMRISRGWNLFLILLRLRTRARQSSRSHLHVSPTSPCTR